jgi:N-acetylglucosamine-6-phosphate deacetylase
VETDGVRVVACGDGPPPRAADVEHSGPVVRGLCDLQVNGAAGVEALDGGAAIDRIDDVLARRGVLRWLAALPTSTEEQVDAVLAEAAERIADPAHGLVGVHLEGPFLSPDYAGVHRAELLRAPADGVPAAYESAAVRLVTLAPELPGALELIARLRRRGIAVALGHSGADADTAHRALDAGATLVTHLFDAMAPLHHRRPGLAGVALTDPRASPCVIADGVHLDPIVLRLVHRAAGERVILVSDASAAAAAPPGAYAIAGTPVRRDADGAVRSADGRLAGSGVLLDEVVAIWAAAAAAGAGEAMSAAAVRPALAIGLDPRIRPGARADLVLLGADGVVEQVMRAGRWVEPAPTRVGVPGGPSAA